MFAARPDRPGWGLGWFGRGMEMSKRAQYAVPYFRNACKELQTLQKFII